jgi:NodT family efflux transporter outer membrane factor (OMF) lipoprotein
LFVAGCQPLSTVPSLPSAVPSQWRNAAPPVAGRASPAPDLVGWWHAFGDPQLDDLVTRALANDFTIAQARERLIAARALALASASEFRPILHAGSSSVPDPDAKTSYLQGEIDAQWELDLFGRGQSVGRIANAGADSAFADLQSARVTLVAETVRDYLALRAAQQQLALLMQVADAQRQRHALMQRRRQLGLAADGDLDAIAGEVAQADAALAEPRLRIEASAQQLAVLCGLTEPPPAWFVAAPMPELTASVPASLPADLLRTRPDIRRAESAVLAATGELGVARADLYPSVSLGGSITAAATTAGGRFGFGHAIPALEPIIDMPLFDWGARRARAAAKDAELAAAVDGYRETVLEALAETEIALANWNAGNERASALRSAVAARERIAATLARGRRLGLADDLDAAAAAIALTQARAQWLDAEQARALAYVALYKALGGAPAPKQDLR